MPPSIAAAIAAAGAEMADNDATRALYENEPRVYELGELEVVEDIAYGPHERHRLDVHTDKVRRSDRPMPVLVYFHGGGFVGGNRAGNRNVADYFASLGLVGVNATYRLAPEAKWPDGAQDVADAVAWIRDNIGDHGGDPSQVFVVGKSAGAAHVATYVFRPDVLKPGTAAPAGAVLISGPYSPDLSEPSESNLAYYGDDLASWPSKAVLGNIARADIPVLMTISEFDSLGLKRSLASLMHELTLEHGRMPRVLQLLGHNHYSPNISIGTRDAVLGAEILELIRSSIAAGSPQLTAR